MKKFLVRLHNGIAIKFHKNFTARKVYSAVIDAEASTFDAQWEAELKAKEHGMHERDFTVSEIFS